MSEHAASTIAIDAGHVDLPDGELLAAVDLGSNSFHMVVARTTLGQLRVVDRLHETVRMAEGLSSDGQLHEDVLYRALACLARFGQRVRDLPHGRVRAIATNTVRRLAQPQRFLVPAETALGHNIEVVSGREEARLIYLGVAQGNPPKPSTAPGNHRLVIDIGGGSTEFIIGHGYESLERESLQMGCVATTRRFFDNGKLGRRAWKDALIEISTEFQQFAATYRARGWQEVIGASGTVKAIGEIAARALDGNKHGRGTITDLGVIALRDRMLGFEHIADIALPGLADDRRPVLAGGLLILEAAFNELGLKRMRVSDSALREGVLYDMLGRASDRDPRDASVQALALRYGVDDAQAARVEATALRLFDQVAESWMLGPDDRLMLAWAARMHELGLAIAHSQYHAHGAYVLENSDIAGFSVQEQRLLAALVGCQRRKPTMKVINALPDRLVPAALRSMLLLRLAVLLHRSHERDPIPPVELSVDERTLTLRLSARWLDAHPLTATDLDGEREYLAAIDFKLRLRRI